jgi:Uma2 family endonuclease
MPPSGRRATRISRRLAARLGDYVDARALGEVTGEQGGYRIGPRTDLAPDVGFVRAERLPPLDAPASDGLIDGAPDLAVEVASPNQYRPGMAAKARRYLAAGTQLVWVVWPKRRDVDIWRPGDQQPSATLTVADTLDGRDVVPGFALPVSELFE